MKLPKLNENLFALVIHKNIFNTWEDFFNLLLYLNVFYDKIKLGRNKWKVFDLNAKINIIYHHWLPPVGLLNIVQAGKSS